MEDLKTLVHYGDVIAVIRTEFGKDVALIDYQVNKATSTVQGYMSIIIRVIAQICIKNEKKEFSFVIKNLPILTEHQNIVFETDVYEREICFLTKIVPMFKSSVPLPKCYLAYGKTIIMEDLCRQGYTTLYNNMKDVVLKPLSMNYFMLIVRKLAKLHAASLEVKDWHPIIGEFIEKDPFEYERFKPFIVNGSKTAAKMLKVLYPYKDTSKYYRWLSSSDNCYNLMLKYLKPLKNGGLNVINHGDCWANNMMFKINPVTQQPIDVKFIDFQLLRYTHPSRDLLYMLYFLCSNEFRQNNEVKILRTYVDAFNTYACTTPDSLNFEEFMKEYNDSRICGQMFGLCIRPLLLMDNVFPEKGDDLTKDNVEAIFDNDNSQLAINQLETDPVYKSVCSEIIAETISNLEGLNLV